MFFNSLERTWMVQDQDGKNCGSPIYCYSSNIFTSGERGKIGKRQRISVIHINEIFPVRLRIVTVVRCLRIKNLTRLVVYCSKTNYTVCCYSSLFSFLVYKWSLSKWHRENVYELRYVTNVHILADINRQGKT